MLANEWEAGEGRGDFFVGRNQAAAGLPLKWGAVQACSGG